MPRKGKAAQEAAQETRTAQETAQDAQEAAQDSRSAPQTDSQTEQVEPKRKRNRPPKTGDGADGCKESCTESCTELVPIKAGKVALTTPKQGLRGHGMAKQLRELIGEQGAQAAAVKLLELMQSPDDRVALQAATVILERVYGKARQEIDVNADNTVRVLLGGDTTDQFAR